MPMNKVRAIQVWRFCDAPEEYQNLSAHGGDEDWLAIVPKEADGWIPWMDEGSSFGCCSVSEHFLENGDKVFIGAHA